MAAAVVQLAGSVLIWHMIEWFSTACCLYGARSKNENKYPLLTADRQAGTGGAAGAQGPGGEAVARMLCCPYPLRRGRGGGTPHPDHSGLRVVIRGRVLVNQTGVGAFAREPGPPPPANQRTQALVGPLVGRLLPLGPRRSRHPRH
jgi:hypothetical protein